ncbi:hypothetical protein [Brevibacterium luteolum]|uniref:Uncharacterized protein n=1 Tax=Brevibacterium luteolum TaxID=199591 RepID=A0A849ASN5_9MICO|nr:hypothetical protein [Brevibacterium luteolum]MBM7529010.1 hypothetical protein [Brevibacterium luteolum]NNG80188.1 hypothetical protein [Brevibacterium luteolum]
MSIPLAYGRIPACGENRLGRGPPGTPGAQDVHAQLVAAFTSAAPIVLTFAALDHHRPYGTPRHHRRRLH